MGFVGERREVVEVGGGQHGGHLGCADQAGVDAERLLHGYVGCEGRHVVGPHPDEVTGATVADVGVEHGAGVLEHLEGLPRHRRQGPNAVVAAQDAAGLGREAGSYRAAFEHHDPPGLAPGQCPRRGQTLDAGADDGDVTGLGAGAGGAGGGGGGGQRPTAVNGPAAHRCSVIPPIGGITEHL